MKRLLALDGAYHEQGAELAWQALGHLKTSEVGEVLERAVSAWESTFVAAASWSTKAAPTRAPRATPIPRAILPRPRSRARRHPPDRSGCRAFSHSSRTRSRTSKPLCVSLDGFTLHAATRAGALDQAGREALLRYVLRPPIAQERLERRPDGLVRIILKKAYADGTVSVDMDPLSLLCRLAGCS